MKKQILLALCLTMFMGCSSKTHQSTNTSSSDNGITITNKVQLNEKTLDMSGYEWLEDTDPAFIQISMEESIRLMDEGGTGVVIYSYPTCPWCNRAIPVLNQTAKDLGVKVYYVDVYEKELMTPTGNTFSDAGKKVIDSLFEHIDSILKHSVNETTGKSEPEFYTPEVVAIKDGKIVGHHMSLVESFEMAKETDQMNDEQKAELEGIYKDLIISVAD